MIRILSVAMLLMFGVTLMGCEAGGRVGDPDDTRVRTEQQRTTHIERDRDRDRVEVEGEIRRD